MKAKKLYRGLGLTYPETELYPTVRKDKHEPFR